MRPPQLSFFAYYIGPLRSVSLLTIWGPPSRQFLCLLYGAPLRSVSSLTIWGPPQINFFTYYRGPLRSVSSHTIWGPPQINFFAYCMGAPSDQLLYLLYGGPPQVSFFAYYMGPPLFFILFLSVKLSLGGPIFFNFQGGGGQVHPLAPPAGAHGMNYWPSSSEVIGSDGTTIIQCQSFFWTWTWT